MLLVTFSTLLSLADNGVYFPSVTKDIIKHAVNIFESPTS